MLHCLYYSIRFNEPKGKLRMVFCCFSARKNIFAPLSYNFATKLIWWGILLFVCQCHIQMYFGTIWTVWAPKKMYPKSCNTFSIYIFHLKPKWNIVYKYLKTKIFSRDFPKCIKYQIFLGTNLKLLGGFEVSLNYLILNFKKMVCPKNVWMWHWQVMINVTKWSFICLLSSDQCFVITPSQFTELFSLKLAYLKFLFLLF